MIVQAVAVDFFICVCVCVYNYGLNSEILYEETITLIYHWGCPYETITIVIFKTQRNRKLLRFSHMESKIPVNFHELVRHGLFS